MAKEVKWVHEDEVIPTVFVDRKTRRLITQEREGSEKVSFHIITADQVGDSPLFDHGNDEILYVIRGNVTLLWNGASADLRPGSAIYLPAGTAYRIRYKGPVKIAAVLSPPRFRSEWAGRPDVVQLEPEIP